MSQAPKPDDIVHVLTRHYVVEGTDPGPGGTVVDLACMDDDSQGTHLNAIWELELDDKIILRFTTGTIFPESTAIQTPTHWTSADVRKLAASESVGSSCCRRLTHPSRSIPIS